MPDLRRLALVALPDEALLARLEKQRGGGRDDYPVRVASDDRRPSARAVAGSSTAALLALCGFSPLDYQDKPKVVVDDDKPRTTYPRSTGSHNFSRFLGSLVKLESSAPWVDGMVRQLREQGRVAGLRRASRTARPWTATRRDRSAARPARHRRRLGEARDDRREDGESLEEGEVVVRRCT